MRIYGVLLIIMLLSPNLHAESQQDSVSGTSTQTANAAAVNPQFHITEVDEAWRKNLPRDAGAATQAYLDRLPADVIARSNAYFEGDYWLQLWNFLLGLLISIILLSGKRSARVRDWAQRVGRKAFFRDAIFGAFYAISSWVIALPLLVYQGYFREHAYGMATQTLAAWFNEQVIGLIISILVMAIAAGVLYAVIRRAGTRWWLWGTGAAVVFILLEFLVSPIWIDPLFNTYKPLSDGPVKAAVLSMAKADGVPVNNVYWYDASRQTTKVSANVSGIFGSAAVRLNDNLLNHASLPEIRAVMGHELGHYVMHHVYVSILEFGLLVMVGFMFAQWAMEKSLKRLSARFDLQGVSDVATLPLLAAIFSIFMFFSTPIANTLIRIQEIEADRFGFNLAREPHGAAEAYLKLTEYRKPDPGPIEEFVFFDHPSTRFRIHAAMQWREAMGTP